MPTKENILLKLYELITSSKQDMLDNIAADRTNYVTVVLEDINKEHNASAVLRTCDCFGVQTMHVIEKNQEFMIHRDIAMGARKWVDVTSYSETETPNLDCINGLKQKGYKIVATTPHTETTIDQLSIDQPIALVFGTERDGISDEIIQHADELIRIPMYGFTESFNISVSAAILLSTLRNKLESSELDWKLSKDEQTELKTKWCTKIIRNGEKVEQEIRKRIKKE
ncbi:MAG: tRNA (guanosine-2'-O-)-methyltransferase [Crocinitomicaceae bacterium]|jgi:tRNA (guanosine-2'-O-)-methyltransferase